MLHIAGLRKQLILVVVLAAVTVSSVLCGRARAQEAPGTTRVALAAAGGIHEDAQVPVVIVDSLSSNSAKKGQSVTFRVFRDVVVGSGVAVRAGSLCMGKVVSVHSAGAFGRAGEIGITCDSLTLPDGSLLPVKLDNSYFVSGHDSSGGAILGGLVVGGIIGALVYAGSDYSHNFLNSHPDHSAPSGAGIAAGVTSGVLVAALVQGGNVHIPVGQHFSVVVNQDASASGGLAPDGAPAR